MTVTIELPPELEKTLRQQAAKSGQDLDTFVLQALKEKMARARTFDKIVVGVQVADRPGDGPRRAAGLGCAPFAQAVEAAAITDEDFDRFFEEVREEAWQERQSKAS